jgi:hypothetical protein
MLDRSQFHTVFGEKFKAFKDEKSLGAVQALRYADGTKVKTMLNGTVVKQSDIEILIEFICHSVTQRLVLCLTNSEVNVLSSDCIFTADVVV